MNLLRKINQHLYYRYANRAINSRSIALPEELRHRKNLFIYFDYEREFGNRLSKVTDKQIITLLNVLKEYKLNTTWFTVGLIFHHYPDSIRNILDHGHEIASHTYAHNPPLSMNYNQQLKDFEQYNYHSQKVTSIRGFHSPNGKWDLKMFRFLCKHGFNYDLASIHNRGQINPLLVTKCDDNYILRLFTLGDDWSYFIDNYSEDEVTEGYKSRIQRIQQGTLAGIGFHPWIIFSKNEIFSGFIRLLEYLQNQQEYNIMNAGWFVKEIIKHNQPKKS